MILVDTGVWIDFLRGKNTPHRHALRRFIEDEEDVAITEIILAEILQGIRDDGDFETVKGYLLAFPIFSPKSIETYLEAARIFRECRKKGKTVRKTVDCIIAAICLENNCTLFHKDSDFDLIEACTSLRCLKV
jgi:predicted nucleic acid-binding protein